MSFVFKHGLVEFQKFLLSEVEVNHGIKPAITFKIFWLLIQFCFLFPLLRSELLTTVYFDNFSIIKLAKVIA